MKGAYPYARLIASSQKRRCRGSRIANEDIELRLLVRVIEEQE